MPQFWLLLKSPKFIMWAVFALALAAIGWSIYSAGEDHIQKKWDAEKVKVEKYIADLEAKQGAVTVKVETVYVDRIKTVTVKGETITKYVTEYITKEADAKCVIPKNLVLILDRAATNTLPKEATP